MVEVITSVHLDHRVKLIPPLTYMGKTWSKLNGSKSVGQTIYGDFDDWVDFSHINSLVTGNFVKLIDKGELVRYNYLIYYS